jgi:sulfur carrier protein
MKVNGKLFLLDSLKTRDIFALLKELQLNPAGVAIERNGEILDREEWNKIVLDDSDKIEIIKFVGGG